jgi:hypothetical protein
VLTDSIRDEASHHRVLLKVMSSRFVSGGTIRSSGDREAVEAAPETGTTQQQEQQQSSKSAEWDIVEKELAAERARREEQRRKAATGEEKSLYDILQENKGRSLHHYLFFVCLGIQAKGLKFSEKERIIFFYCFC